MCRFKKNKIKRKQNFKMSSDLSEKNINSKYDLVILNKVDSDGNFSLLHTKPLTVELFHQVIKNFLN